MKSRLRLTQLLVLALFSGLFLASCDEHSQNGTDEQQQIDASKVSSESDGEAESFFNGLFDDAMGVNTDVALGNTGIFGRGQACPTITITHLNPNQNPPAYFPARVVIDFGSTPCPGNDGHLRRGKIIIEYTNRLIYPDAMAVTTFDNFYIDSIKIEGTHKIKNTTPANPQPLTRQFTIDVVDARLTRPNGDYTNWNSHHVMTQMEGVSTLTHLDDVFKMTGSAGGRVRRNNLISLWESTIIEPLVKRFTCKWILKGTIRTVRTGTSVNGPYVALLDFGNGLVCDRLATITINGRTHQITLP